MIIYFLNRLQCICWFWAQHNLLKTSYIACCYIPRLSLNKMSTAIGWFLVTCPWSNSNVFWWGYNCAVVACAPLRERLIIYNKALNVWSLGKLALFVFPQDHALGVFCHNCSDKGQILEMLALGTICSGKFMLSTQLIKPTYCTLTSLYWHPKLLLAKHVVGWPFVSNVI